MKKAEYYLLKFVGRRYTNTAYNAEEIDIMEAIKQAQLDAIDETVKLCAENAYCDLIHPPDEDYPDLEESEYLVVKQSILNCAEILKQRL